MRLQPVHVMKYIGRSRVLPNPRWSDFLGRQIGDSDFAFYNIIVVQQVALPDTNVPLWVMVIGAFGISFDLFLFGPKLIRMFGNQITKLNAMRAYCVALSTAITVIISS